MEVVTKKRKLPLVLVKDLKKEVIKNARASHSPQYIEFYEWLDNALPGEKYCYYSGNYVSGKSIAKFIHNLYINGLITMCQSKDGKIYHYWAIKSVPRQGGKN